MPKNALASNVMQEFDSEFLANAPELYIFSACRHIVDLLAAAQAAAGPRGKARSRRQERISRLFIQLCGLAQATERFDVVLPFSPATGFAPCFWRWFNWWHDYRRALTPDELDLVHCLQDACDPAALEFRPRGDWLGYRSTPPDAVKKAG